MARKNMQKKIASVYLLRLPKRTYLHNMFYYFKTFIHNKYYSFITDGVARG